MNTRNGVAPTMAAKINERKTFKSRSVAVHRGLTPQVYVRRPAVQWAESRARNVLVVQVLPGDALDLFGVDGIDAKNHLGGRNATTVGEDLSAHLFASRLRGARAAEESNLEFALAAGDLLVSDTEGEKVDAEHELPDAVFDGHLVASCVKAENASVLIEVVERLELVSATYGHLVGNGIDRTVARNIARHQTCVLLVGTDDVLHDHESDGVAALPGNRLPTHGHVCSRAHLIVAVDELG